MGSFLRFREGVPSSNLSVCFADKAGLRQRVSTDGEVGLRRTFSETRALSEKVTFFTRSIVQKVTYAR